MAKLFIAANRAIGGVTEAESTALISEQAMKKRLPDERSDTCFARFYPAPQNVELRRAHQITKSYPQLLDLEPTFVSGADATDVNSDSSKAYEQLQTMANALRTRSPELTVAQAFARVCV